MYDCFEKFENDALKCSSKHYPDSSLTEEKIKVAYEVYQNASQGTKLLDADGNTIEFGVTIVGRLAREVKSVNENGEEKDTWLPADESFPSIVVSTTRLIMPRETWGKLIAFVGTPLVQLILIYSRLFVQGIGDWEAM